MDNFFFIIIFTILIHTLLYSLQWCYLLWQCTAMSIFRDHVYALISKLNNCDYPKFLHGLIGVSWNFFFIKQDTSMQFNRNAPIIYWIWSDWRTLFTLQSIWSRVVMAYVHISFFFQDDIKFLEDNKIPYDSLMKEVCLKFQEKFFL